jgi:hypothetical protein
VKVLLGAALNQGSLVFVRAEGDSACLEGAPVTYQIERTVRTNSERVCEVRLGRLRPKFSDHSPQYIFEVGEWRKCEAVGIGESKQSALANTEMVPFRDSNSKLKRIWKVPDSELLRRIRNSQLEP